MFADFLTSTQEEWWADALKTAKVSEKTALMSQVEENLVISPIYTHETKTFTKILPKKNQEDNNSFVFKSFEQVKNNTETDAEICFFDNILNDKKNTQKEAQMMPIENYLLGKNPNFVFSARGFKESGANTSQQLGFLLAKWVIQADFLVENQKDISLTNFVQNTTWQLSIGRNYFVEIAKFRACRILWARILEIYNLDNKIPLEIHAFTGLNNKSLADIENNLLRNTTEAMSAIIGNIDVLTIFPHGFPQNSFEDGKRLAENIANLLTDESHITKTQDLLAGAYSVETLTLQICENAWEFFQKIMEKGGVFETETKEFLENECQKNIESIKKNIENKKNALVGVHTYQQHDGNSRAIFNKSKDFLSQYGEGWKMAFLEEM